MEASEENELVGQLSPEDTPPSDWEATGPLSTQKLVDILGLTIKRDENNKLVAFLAGLTCYTEDSQLNISFNAPSSTGKSFIPTEVAQLFPPDDVIEIAYCSPTAFFHDYGQFDKEKGGYIVDLSRKILVFLDQPHTLLLQHLRPVLSHDKKEIRIKITDKSQKMGLRTKNVFVIGFPVVIFCTAGLNINDQEATRFLLLSPETNQEKIREAVLEKIKKESGAAEYRKGVEANPDRLLLKKRIQAIKEARISEVKIGNPGLVISMFFEKLKTLKPRHQRDIARLISLVKSFALLNMWFRDREGLSIIANDDDIKSAFEVWNEISASQELNLPPYVYNLYYDVVLAAFQDKNRGNEGGNIVGLSRKDILAKHFEVYGRLIADWQLRQEILPMLETAGLIYFEEDNKDRRKTLIYPTTPLTTSSPQNNSESHGGVQPQEGGVGVCEHELKYLDIDGDDQVCTRCGQRWPGLAPYTKDTVLGNQDERDRP